MHLCEVGPWCHSNLCVLLCWCPQQEGYELLETHDFQGAIVIVDYLVKTMMGNLQVSGCVTGTAYAWPACADILLCAWVSTAESNLDRPQQVHAGAWLNHTLPEGLFVISANVFCNDPKQQMVACRSGLCNDRLMHLAAPSMTCCVHLLYNCRPVLPTRLDPITPYLV